MFLIQLDSPIGILTLTSDGTALTGLWMENQKYAPKVLRGDINPALPVFRETAAWLEAYFSHDLPPALPLMAPKGTAFRQAVWTLLREIPYGEITTYGALTQKLRQKGIPASAQAVGGAVGHNPISILIPCHRVLGHDGSLTDYAGGLEIKRLLLTLEGVI